MSNETMNDMSPDDRHDYDRYANDVLRLEWEQAEAQRQVMLSDDNTTLNVGDVIHVGMGCGEGGRHATYETGVIAPDGGRERVSTMLCWRCDAEAEYAGYCEAHYDQHLQEVADDEYDSLQEPDWDELNEIYSQEELKRMQREEQERRDDH